MNEKTKGQKGLTDKLHSFPPRRVGIKRGDGEGMIFRMFSSQIWCLFGTLMKLNG